MIIIYERLAYKVTRYSASSKLERALEYELEKTGKFSTELCESMLAEIIENTEFPEILDESKIFVYDETSESFTGYNLTDKLVKEKKVFTIKDFSPKCKVTTLTKEAKAFFQKYSLNHLIGSSENGVQHPVVYFYNEECLVDEMDKNPAQVLTKAFKEIVGIKNAEKMANAASDKVFTDTLVFVTFVKKGCEANCYALHLDGSVRETSPFSVNSIYKAIMAELPKMKCTSEKAKTAANYAHNKILYGIGITDFILESPADFSEDGKPVFEREIKGYTFWIKPGMENWRSKEMFSETIGEIAWGSYEIRSHIDSTARARKYKSASYMGFSIVPAWYREAEPFFRAGENVLCGGDSIRVYSWTSYGISTCNERESIPVFDKDGHNSSLSYLGKFASNIGSITDILYFKLETRAEIL